MLFEFIFKPVSYDLKELYIMKPKATCHITRQASINARAWFRYPIKGYDVPSSIYNLKGRNLCSFVSVVK